MGGMTSFHDHSAMLAGATDNASGIGAELASNIEVKAHSEMANSEQGKRYWAGIASMDDPDNKTLPVDVTAMQFAFIFHYPEGNITSGELHVSAGQPVQLRMEARDVIHAFWVPQFRLKQDIIPGQPTLLSFTPTKPGTYPIVCAELCGPYHGGMRTNVVVHDPDSFQTWLDQNRQPAISA
jgi:cytochrome c oxidase subunit 2